MKAYRKVLGYADTAMSGNYDPSTEQQIAGFTAPTFQAFDQVQQNQGIANDYLQSAAGYGADGAGAITGGEIQDYLNPYTDMVVDATQRDFDVQNARQQSGVVGNARMAGSLGGDREAVARALTSEAQSRVQSPILAGLRSQGYSTALGAAQGDAQRQLAAAGQFANLGQTAQQTAYTDVGQLYQAGGMQQGLTQAQYDAASANAAARAAHPYSEAQWYAGVVGATAPGMGSTSSGTSVTQGPTPNTWSQVLGGGLAALPYLATLADGGRVDGGFGQVDGYIPRMALAPGVMLHGPAMSAPQQAQSASDGGGFAGGAKMMSGAMDGLSKIGGALRTTNAPGGWATTVNPESAAGWSNYFGNMEFAQGGAVPRRAVGGGIVLPYNPSLQPAKPPSEMAGHMADIVEMARMLRAENGMSAKAEGGEISGFDWAAGLPMVSDYGLSPGQAPAVPGIGPVVNVPDQPMQGSPYTPPPQVAGWQTTVTPTAAPAMPSGISAPVTPALSKRQGFGEWLASDDAVNMLVPMGLNIMGQGAGGKGSFGLNVGRGAAAGLDIYRKGESDRKNREQQQQQINQAAERLQMQAQEMAEQSKMRALEHPYKMRLTKAEAMLKERQANAVDEGKLIEVGGQIVRVPPQGDAKVVYGQNVTEQRRQQIKDAGLDPEAGANKVYIATGKMPREDQQPLSATDKKAILEADEMVLAGKNTIEGLNKALDLSKKAYAGSVFGIPGTGAGVRSAIAANAPWSTPEADATRELQNVVISQALESLKSTFGAAPTEGERKILLEIQGSVDQPLAVREAIYKRGLALAQRRMQFNQQRADELRGGTYYGGKGGGGAWKGGSGEGGISKPNTEADKSPKPASQMTDEEILRQLQ